MKKKNMLISTDTQKKAFDRIQHPSLIQKKNTKKVKMKKKNRNRRGLPQ